MKIKYLVLGCFLFLGVSCDTKQNIFNSGISSPYFDGSIMEYLRSDNENWELTVEMIERAGLIDLFEGKVDTLPTITFFAPTSYSIFRYLMDSQTQKLNIQNVYYSVQDIPAEECRRIILKHVVQGKHLKEEIRYRDKNYEINSPSQTGGSDFICIGGNKVRAYLEASPYAGVPDAGPVTLNLYSLSFGKIVPMASPDIQPENGVVHALNYDYCLDEI